MFIENGKTLRYLNADINDGLVEKIPAGAYLVRADMNGYFIEKIAFNNLPSKLYGNPNRIVNKVLKSFENTNKNLGVLFSGEKGCGKTITLQMIAQKANIPVLYVTEKYKDCDFKNFVSGFKQEICIVFDEFEKVFRRFDEQEDLDNYFPLSIKSIPYTTTNEGFLFKKEDLEILVKKRVTKSFASFL